MGYSFTVKKGKLPVLVRLFGMHITDLSEGKLLRELTPDDFINWPDTVMSITEVTGSDTGIAYRFKLYTTGIGIMRGVEFIGFFDNQTLVDKFLQSLSVDFKKTDINKLSSTIWLTYSRKA